MTLWGLYSVPKSSFAFNKTTQIVFPSNFSAKKQKYPLSRLDSVKKSFMRFDELTVV